MLVDNWEFFSVKNTREVVEKLLFKRVDLQYYIWVITREKSLTVDSYNNPKAKNVSWFLSSLQDSSDLGLDFGFAGSVMVPPSSMAGVTPYYN